MNNAWEAACGFIDSIGWPFIFVGTQVRAAKLGFQMWRSAVRSQSMLCRSQAVLIAAIVGMYAVILVWENTGGGPPTWMSVTGAIVITTGWTAIAGAAAGRMVARLKKASTP